MYGHHKDDGNDSITDSEPLRIKVRIKDPLLLVIQRIK